MADESVDLVYLDPPFNSSAGYNVLFKAPEGHESHAQMEAFDDTWHWGEAAEKAFDEVMISGNTEASEMLRAMRDFLKENDMMAYLAMMAVRLLELHRVLKPTGSLYLHCDPTASHYLKILLDAVFGKERFQNEITWKRTTAHSNVSSNYGAISDIIFYYTKSGSYTWNQQYRAPADIEKAFPQVDGNGRRWRSENMRNPGIRPNLHYPYTASNGITYQPHPNGWTVSLDRMRMLDADGRLHFPKNSSGRLRAKLFADESKGIKLQNIWDDINAIGAQAQERLGYPTQKPQALLERILLTSSNEGDVVLDPFCGCGTTIHAAQKLNRRWIGIDVTNLAISLIRKRLRDAFPMQDLNFDVEGVPRDMDGARALAEQDKYQFQWWAVSLVDAVPFGGKKKGADGGIDGYIYFKVDPKTTEKAVVSVKGGSNVGVGVIRDLIATVERDRAKMGVLLTLTPPTREMTKEAVSAGFYKTEFGEFAKIQILTIEDLFDGKRPHTPWIDPTVFKKAKREMKGEQGTLL